MEANMAQARAASTRAASTRAASNSGEHSVKGDFDALRSDLDTLREDVGALVNTLRSNASSRAEAELDALRQRVFGIANDLQTTGRQQLRNVEGKIEERPFMSLGIAFATGFAVARMLERR
jgi:ElaB/YqjD/DUF883 family membrane-anchored ribosome-binding protein